MATNNDECNEKLLISIQELATQLNVSVSWLREQVKKKTIPYYRLGTGDNSMVRFSLEKVREWLDKVAYQETS